jgi:hypothetical protein
MESESYRKECMKRQTRLRKILLDPERFDEAIQQLLTQHAMLHAMEMAYTESWSYEDEIFQGLTEMKIRHIPPNQEHSISWNIWHIARIEDVTMNILVSGNEQIYTQNEWPDMMKISSRDTGNLMSKAGIENLSKKIDIDALRDYRLTVGRQTRKIINRLKPADLKRKVDPSRVEKIKEEGAVVETASDLLDYWSKRNIAGLMLMPATRHNLVHLNECKNIKALLQ